MTEYPMTNDKGKRYREDEASNGDLLRHYEDGTIYNMTQKHLEAGPADNRITTANGASMAEKRVEKRRRAVEKAIAKGEDVEAGLEDLARAQVRIAKDPDEYGGHASTRAFQALIDAGGYGDKVLAVDSVSMTKNGVRLEGTPERLAKLASALEGERERRRERVVVNEDD